MRLIDAHHHLWDLAVVDYPWLRAHGVRRFFGDPTPIQRDYRPADLRRDAGPHEIVASVHVQVGAAAGQELAETAWLAATAERTGLPTAIVAAVDLTADDVEARLDAQLAQPRVRGVRHILGREPADDARTGAGRVLEHPGFVRGLRALAERDLSFDLQLTVPQMARVVDVLGEVPELRVAVCHVGSPWDRTSGGFAAWRRGLVALAQRPGCRCKLSGLSMFEPAWTPASYATIVRAAVEAFGIERCMFGSNFPVDGLHRGYAEIVAATRAAVAPYASADEHVFERCARDFYRL